MAGGSYTNKGINYQLWYTAQLLSEVFFDNTIIVEPEADLYENINCKEVLIVKVDDIVVRKKNSIDFYNIKYDVPPPHSKWNASLWESQGVLKQFKEQFEDTPDGNLHFVTSGAINVLRRTIEHSYTSKSLNEYLSFLKENKETKKEWESLNKKIAWKADKVFRFLQQIKIWITHEVDIANNIKFRFKDHVTNYHSVPTVLHKLAGNLAKSRGATANQTDVIEFLKKHNIHRKAHLSPTTLEKFQSISRGVTRQTLAFGKNQFYLEREEIKACKNWIKQKLSNNDLPILLLTGHAGYGKTTILKKLTSHLQEKNTPVLAIKVDVFSDLRTNSSIYSAMGWDDNLPRLLASLSEQHERIVLIFDQLDALSQFHAGSKTTLQALKLIIEDIIHNTDSNKVRIVLGCRNFDLLNDPTLEKWGRSEKLTKIEVGLLSFDELETVLNENGLKGEDLPNALKILLPTAHHLQLFLTTYHQQLDLESLKTARDLFNELWKQKIEYSEEPRNLKETLSQIVQEMYEQQQLFVENFSNEKTTAVLCSKGILNKTGNKIQFFHQSFYNVVLSKLYYNSKNIQEILRLIQSNHQGFFAVARLRELLKYLRYENAKLYYKTLESLMKSVEIRWFLKFTIIRQVAIEIAPSNEEKRWFNQSIRQNEEWFILFLEGIDNEYWLQYILQQQNLKKIFLEPEKYNDVIEAIFQLLRRKIDTFPDSSLTFLWNNADIIDNPTFILYLLLRLQNWTNSLSVKIFKKYEWAYDSHNYRLHSKEVLLEHALQGQLEWALDYVFKDIQKKIEPLLVKIKEESSILWPYDRTNFISDDYRHFFDYLFKEYPDVSRDFGLKIITMIINKTQLPSINRNSIIRGDFSFYNKDRKEMRLASTHYHLYTKVEDTMKEVAISQPNQFLDLAKKLMATNQASLILLVLKTLQSLDVLFSNNIFKVIEEVEQKRGLNENSKISYEVRQLISTRFTAFSKEQKNWLADTIFQLRCPVETTVRIYGDQKSYSKYFGLNQYYYLEVFPKEYIFENAKLKRRYQELQRKFGIEVKDLQPGKIQGGWMAVHSRLPEIAIRRMSIPKLAEAINSISKTDRIEDAWQLETTRLLEKIIKETPYEFLPRLKELLDTDIHPQYKASMVTALSKAKIDLKSFIPIIEAAVTMLSHLMPTVALEVLRAIPFLIKNQYMSRNVLNFIKKCALEGEYYQHMKDKKNGMDFVTEGINSPRGEAVRLLTYINFKPELKQNIFEILEKVIDDPDLATRTCLIYSLAYLNKLDKSKALNLFLKATKNAEEELFEVSIPAAQYMMNVDFEAMNNYFEKAMTIPEIQQSIGQLLTLATFSKHQGSNDLLKSAIVLSNAAKTGSIKAGFTNINSEYSKIQAASLKIILQYQKYIHLEEVNHQYAIGLNELPKVLLPELRTILKNLCETSQLKRREDAEILNALQYLIPKHPEMVIDILHPYTPSPSYLMYWSKRDYHPLQLIQQAYLRVSEEQNEDYMEKAIEIYERFLKILEIRSWHTHRSQST